MAHRDLKKLCTATSRQGHKADFTSENLFRALIVMQQEGIGYREAMVRIAESETLQNFCRPIKKKSIDYTLFEQGIRRAPSRNLGDDEPGAGTRSSCRREDFDRARSDGYHGYRMQYPLANRFKPAGRYLSRNCPENIAWEAT